MNFWIMKLRNLKFLSLIISQKCQFRFLNLYRYLLWFLFVLTNTGLNYIEKICHLDKNKWIHIHKMDYLTAQIITKGFEYIFSFFMNNSIKIRNLLMKSLSLFTQYCIDKHVTSLVKCDYNLILYVLPFELLSSRYSSRYWISFFDLVFNGHFRVRARWV